MIFLYLGTQGYRQHNIYLENKPDICIKVGITGLCLNVLFISTSYGWLVENITKAIIFNADIVEYSVRLSMLLVDVFLTLL